MILIESNLSVLSKGINKPRKIEQKTDYTTKNNRTEYTTFFIQNIPK